MFDLDALASHWAVTFAIGLAALVFLVKLFVHRRLTPIDALAGIAELPSDVAAACLSLATAYLWIQGANAKVGSIAFLFMAGSFITTTAGFRYVDDVKGEFLTKPVRIISTLVISYSVLYLFSIQIISQIYRGVGQ